MAVQAAQASASEARGGLRARSRDVGHAHSVVLRSGHLDGRQSREQLPDNAIIVARSMVDPLRRLQSDALEIASVRLPARVAELSEATDPSVSLDVEPISVQSTIPLY